MVLLAAAVKLEREDLAHKAITIAAERLPRNDWAEYYDGKNGRLVGKESRKFQTWTIASYLLAQEFVAEPKYIDWLSYKPKPLY